MTIGYRQFVEMLKTTEAKSPEDLIAAYPDIPPEDIRDAWEVLQRFIARWHDVISPAFTELYGSDVERLHELMERLEIPEEPLEEASFTEMLEHRERLEALEDGLNIMIASAPKVEKRGPGRPTLPYRIQAYNFIRSGRMSHKQAFDWWLEQAGEEPFDEDDYNARFESFKDAYRAWKSRQERKNN